MAALENHHPFIIMIGLIGNSFSILVYFAPLPTFIRIFKGKSTESFHSDPYAFSLLSSILWSYYAIMKGNSILMLSINLFGSILEGIFLIIFVTYASRVTRVRTTRLLALLAVSFTLIFLFTFFLLKGQLLITILGWICVMGSVLVFAAPFSIIKVVIRSKSVQYMPFTLSFFLTLSAITWFTYGLLLKDYYVALPNVVGFIFSVLQMMIYGVYRNPKLADKVEKLPLIKRIIAKLTPAEAEMSSSKLTELNQVHGGPILELL